MAIGTSTSNSEWRCESLEAVGLPANYHHYCKQLSEGKVGGFLRMFGCFSLPFGTKGFEDVLPKAKDGKNRRLGEGLYYNTSGSVGQLAFALAEVKGSVVEEIFKATKAHGSAATISELRREQVLAGLKVLDLGSGEIPGFALAAKALGAEVHTVDGRELPGVSLSRVDSHTAVDLNDPMAACRIYETTGGEFGLVSEHVVGRVKEAMHFSRPSETKIQCIGTVLLASGGYLHEAPNKAFYKPTQ